MAPVIKRHNVMSIIHCRLRFQYSAEVASANEDTKAVEGEKLILRPKIKMITIPPIAARADGNLAVDVLSPNARNIEEAIQ